MRFISTKMRRDFCSAMAWSASTAGGTGASAASGAAPDAAVSATTLFAERDAGAARTADGAEPQTLFGEAGDAAAAPSPLPWDRQLR